MTLWASRDGQHVTIHGNASLNVRIEGSKVHEFAVTEHAQHLKHFWGQLGALIEQAEAEARAAAEVADLEEGLDSGKIPGGF